MSEKCLDEIQRYVKSSYEEKIEKCISSKNNYF